MTLHVAVDFGTSSTCVAVSVDGREPQVVVVDGGSPVMPSAVFAAVDGTLFVGQEAERQAAIDPARYEPNPKRRIDEGDLLLGNTVIGVADVVRAVLSRAVGEARRLAGGATADLLVLTHPADWGGVRTSVLRAAGQGLATELVLVPEPVAAAVFHAASHSLPDGSALAVLDLGGGTVDVSVVRRQDAGGADGDAVAGFRVLATHGDPNFGGADIDQLLLDHVGGLLPEADRDDWQRLMEGREMTDRRRRRTLRQDVRGAKETLSRHTYTDVPMPPPLPDAHVTRGDLEKLIAGPLRRAAALTVETIAEAGLEPERLAAVFLVGGSSRIPLVARLVYQRTGIVPTTLDQPETVVARGALRAVVLDPPRSGALPAQHRTGGVSGVTAAMAPVPARYRTAAAPGGANQSPAPPARPAPDPAEAVTQQIPAQPAAPAPAPSSATAAGPTRRRGRRPAVLAGGAIVVVVAVAAAVLAARGNGTVARPTAVPALASATPKVISQYDYRFTVPKGWAQSGTNSGALEVQITPESVPAGGDAVYVREFPLSYDATANRGRAIGELQPQVAAAGYLNFRPRTTYAGRTVAYYQQPGNDRTVDWYVVFQGRVQVSVGCQYPPTDQATVDPVCQDVVRGLAVPG